MELSVHGSRPPSFAVLASLAVIAAGCGSSTGEAPWNTNPGVDGHAQFLPLRGTSHDPTGAANPQKCEGCHPGTTFKDFVCTTCHTAAQTDPIHVSSLVPAYVAGAVTSADCYRCHPHGAGMDPAAHAAFFPIGTAAHPASCRNCHTDPVSRKDRTKLACVDCHSGAGFDPPASVHGNVRDYPTAGVTNDWCLRCHADGTVLKISAHRGYPVADKPGELGGPDNHGHCFDCHTMVPPAFGGPAGQGVPNRPWAQNWKQSSCSSCHK